MGLKSAVDIMWQSSETKPRWPSGLRPVDLQFDACGRLLVSSDGEGGGGIVTVSMVRAQLQQCLIGSLSIRGACAAVTV